MKKSLAVTILISGSILAGCDRDANDWTSGNSPAITNNTYRSGYGYWHAPYRGWFPYPYNYYSPGFGYYHGGIYSDLPERSPIVMSSPRSSSWFGGRFGGFGGSEGHGSISRGGFGGHGRGGS